MPLRTVRQRLAAHLDVVGIVALLVVGLGTTTVRYLGEVDQLREDYRGRRHLESQLVAKRVDAVFRQLYQGLRTMTLLPGVRTIDRYGEQFAADSRAAMQQIYNNTYENVQLSEVYILPPTLDHERLDPRTGKGEEPVLSFDEFITDSGGSGATPAAHDDELPEDGLQEYREFHRQLAYLAAQHPDNQSFRGIHVPAIVSGEIVTCDNTEWTAADRARGDDAPRAGIALTLPRYDLDGRFAGGVSGIVRTRVLARTLPAHTTAIVAPFRGYQAIRAPSDEWTASRPFFAAGRGNPDLIYSEVLDLHVADIVPWQLWVACPDADFWNLPEVDAARTLWLVGSTAVLLLGLACSWIAREARTRNRRLELMVATTTEELTTSNHRMRLILDTAAQGFLMVELDGTVGAGTSLAVTRWFGPIAAGTVLCDLLYGADAAGSGAFRCGFEQLVEGTLPFEVAVDQLPRRLERDGRTFGLDYRPVLEWGRLVRLLVVVSDVTAVVEAERAEADHRELHAAMQHQLGDRVAFQRFVVECSELVANLTSTTDRTSQRRLLHTLKGNTALHGFQRFADHCHALETNLGEPAAPPTGAGLGALQQEWARLQHRLAAFLTVDPALRVEPAHYQQLLERVRANAPHEDLLQELHAWQLEPVLGHLRPLGRQAERLAESLGKQLTIHVDDHCVRMPSGTLPHLWPALVHLVRNAIDHSIEPPAERTAAGKPAVGALGLTCDLTADTFELVVADDGRGIAWPKIAAKAAAMGLPNRDHTDLVAALFADGFSTAEEITAVSGRGVGLSAVRQACEAAGGRMQVVSEPGRGTRWSLQFPRRALPGLLQVCFPATERATGPALADRGR